MKKTKDGKVLASLTEVKNKTGDIFSLVDEFGEVILTSYNKQKYVITKIDVSERITLETSSSDEKVKSTPKPEIKTSESKKVIAESTPVVATPTEIPGTKNLMVAPVNEDISTETETVTVETTQEDTPGEEMNSNVEELKPWNRNNKKEKSFAKDIKKPLQ